MVRLESLALVGDVPRDGVSIKILVVVQPLNSLFLSNECNVKSNL